MKKSLEILNNTVEEMSLDCININELLHEYKFGGIKEYFVESIILKAMEKYGE